ncbi:MAG TPA: hypothetical protein P5160_01415 [Candidatus Omnitrophota bacterium]|nr:hypothetical protein [Candidatus Omnitrophota bacterium]
MKKHIPYYCSVFICGLFLAAGPRAFLSAQAQTADSISTDTFLEYTLADLREKMDKAIEQNRQLSAKNDSLQKRMLFLNQEMRQFSDEKMALMEQSVKLRESIKLGVNEAEVLRKHANNARERKQHLQLEVGSLAKRIASLDAERKLLVEKTEDVKTGLLQAQEGVRAKGDGSLLEYYFQEKYKFLDLVTQARARIQEKEDQLDTMDLGMAKELSRKERELLLQQSRQEEIASLRLKLRESRDKYDLLDKTRRKIQDQANVKVKDFEAGLSQLRNVHKELNLAINQLKDAKTRIEQGFEAQQKALEEQIGFLQEQNELLFLKKRDIETLALLKERGSRQEHEKIVLAQEHNQLLERARLIKEERKSVENGIAAQKKTGESFKRDHDRLKNEILDLERDLTAMKNKTEQMRKAEFGQKKEELKGLLLQKKQNVVKMDDESKGLEAAFQQQQAALNDSRQRQTDLGTRLEEMANALKDAKQLAMDLSDQRQNFSLRSGEVSQTTRDDIKALKLRKKALEGSLDVINKKYQAGQLQADSRGAEFAELEGYLSVLKKENAGLKKKIKALQ